MRLDWTDFDDPQPAMRSTVPPVLGRTTAARMMLIEPADLWHAYEAAAESNSLATDMLTSASVMTMGDSVAQVFERLSDTDDVFSADLNRVARFGAFGVADGAVAHAWFFALDKVVGEDGTLGQTLLKVAGDALVYSPLWCVWFLAAFALLERRNPIHAIRSEWLELFRGNLGFFLPLTGVIYGVVPRNQRVLAETGCELVYTTILSLWRHGDHAVESGS